MSHLRLWAVAARPRTLPAAIAPVLVAWKPCAAGGRGANTCCGSRPAHMLCMPPSGSQTLIGLKVSPW